MGLFGKGKSESQGSQSAGEGAERAGGTNWFAKKADAGSKASSGESGSGQGGSGGTLSDSQLEENGW